MADWGILGIGFIILFMVAAFGVQGDTPVFDDPIEEIRSFYTDDATRYLVGDFLIGVSFVLLFLPFLVILRRILGWVEGGPNILSWLVLIGGLSMTLLGGAGSVSGGALALGAAADAEVTDSSIRALMYVNDYAFSMLTLPAALFLFAASAVIFRTKVLWQWLALLGLAAGVLGVIGSAWPIDGDPKGALGIILFISFLGFALWVLLVSINLILKGELPA